MSSFGIEKDGMSGTLMSGIRKTIVLGATLTSLGRMWRGTMACHQQCPILTLTLASSLAFPITAVSITCCHSQGQGRPEDIIAMAKTPSPTPSSANIAARPPLPLKTTAAISTQPLQRPLTSLRPPLSPLPSPLHSLQPLPPSSPYQLLSPLSSLPPLLLPPPLPPPPALTLASAVTIAAASPTSLHLQRSCRWLVVVLSVAPHLLHCPRSKFVSPPCHAVVNVDNDCYCHRQQLPLPLP